MIIYALRNSINNSRLSNSHVTGNIGEIILAFFNGFIIGRDFLLIVGETQQQVPAIPPHFRHRSLCCTPS